MNTLGYQITNDSVSAYQSWMLPELHEAMAAEPTHRTVRQSVARSLVRMGAWMLPDRPQMVTDSVLVLPRRVAHRDVQKAA